MKVILLALHPPQKKKYSETEEWLGNHGSIYYKERRWY